MGALPARASCKSRREARRSGLSSKSASSPTALRPRPPDGPATTRARRAPPPGDRAHLHRAHGQKQPPLRLERHWSRITAAIREIYTAPTVEAAETRFADFEAEWQDVYPTMIEAWRSVWTDLVPSLEFPADLRMVGYTPGYQRDRVAERALPPRRPSPRPLPRRAGRTRGALAGRDAEAQESTRHDRQDQRLEAHPQHADRPLRRPHRRQQHQLKINDRRNQLHKKSDTPQ